MNLRFFYIVFLFIAFSSCKTEPKVNMQTFREGEFEIPAGKKYDRTTFIRTGNYQIETYNERVDTLIIHWKNNFNYTLQMLHPKSDLDEEPINVKITKVSGNSYDFEAIIGHSNYVQKGTVNKLIE